MRHVQREKGSAPIDPCLLAYWPALLTGLVGVVLSSLLLLARQA